MIDSAGATRRFVGHGLGLLALATLLVACHGRDRPARPTFSPNGEPLIGRNWAADCEDAEGQWFDRLDVGHTGKVTLAQLQADAEKQFKLMDLRHDGKVTAAELSTYRLKSMGGHYISLSTPEQKETLERIDTDEDERPGRNGSAGRSSDRVGDHDSHRQIDAFAALTSDQPDPVMSADNDLDGSVTIEEFRALVAQNFAEFDSDHEGYITRSEVQSTCNRK